MKKFLILITNEFKVIKISIVIAAITLMLFTASLFSVLNVYVNLSSNILDNLDKSDCALSFSAQNISLMEQELTNINGCFYGFKSNITHNAVLKSKLGVEFVTEQKLESEENIQVFSYSGIAYVSTERCLQKYEQYNEYICGTFPQKANEICLSNRIATGLNVVVGDTICIADMRFFVCGIYDETLSSDLSNYYICVDWDFIFDDLNIELSNSFETFKLYNKLHSKGVSVQIPPFYETYTEGIAATDGFLLSIAFTIFFADVIIVYAMFSMMIINRKKYICRLLTLGASNLLIFGIFYSILAGIVTVVNIAAYWLSVVFGQEIISVCGKLFDMEFVVTRNPLMLIVYLLINLILSAIIYMFQIKKVNRQVVLDSVKGE